MKTLIFNGSPRRQGDTQGLLDILCGKIGGECKIVDAYRADISPCVDCRYCWGHVGCAIDDGMQEIYDYICECDNIVIASPIYFSELTGKLLDLGSRLQTYFCARIFRKEAPIAKPKKGAVVLVGGSNGSFDKAYSTARLLLDHMNCKDILPALCANNTDTVPAVENQQVLNGLEDIARFFVC